MVGPHRAGFAAQLQDDAETLGLDERTDIVKAGLALLHRRAAEARMAASVDDFYLGAVPPLPIGVLPDEGDESGFGERADARDRP